MFQRNWKSRGFESKGKAMPALGLCLVKFGAQQFKISIPNVTNMCGEKARQVSPKMKVI